MIRAVPLDELARRWAEVEPILARATRHTNGCYEPIDVLGQALRGQCSFWFIERNDTSRLDAVVVTELRQLPRKRVLMINFIAGRGLAHWWGEFVEIMDRIAHQAGAAIISAYGRPGWSRYWKSRGIATTIASEIMVRQLP